MFALNEQNTQKYQEDIGKSPVGERKLIKKKIHFPIMQIDTKKEKVLGGGWGGVAVM